MNPRPGISAVFPAYNDAGTIPSMVLGSLAAMRQLTDDYEIIVTNDGSADHTALMLDELASLVPCLRVIHHPHNLGYGSALRTGFDAATKELVFYTDGDAQYDPAELALLAPAMKPGIDIVNGYKIARNDPWHRIVVGHIYRLAMKTLFKLPIRDVDCDFRLIRRDCFRTVPLTSKDGTLPLEMVRKFSDAGFRFAEVPVHHFHRAYGQSQFFNMRRLVRVLRDVVRLWWKLVVQAEHLRREGPAVTVPPPPPPAAAAPAAEAPQQEPVFLPSSSVPAATSFYAGRQVMVVGGLGFIGTALALELQAAGARVTVVDALIPDTGGQPFHAETFVEGTVVHIADAGDPRLPGWLDGCSVVFNLAGQVSHVDSMRRPLADMDANLRAPLALLEACREHAPTARVVYTSTRQVYGVPVSLPLDGSHPVQPVDVNGVHKHAAERLHLMYQRVHGLDCRVLRLTNTYGPRMLVRHARQTALGWFVRLAIDGQTIQIWGDGAQRRDYTHVDDVVGALLLAGQAPDAGGCCLDLGGLRPVSHLELMRTLTEVAGRGDWRLQPFPEEHRRIDIGDAYSSRAEAQRQLGWQPRIDLREGLADTVAFFDQHRARYW